MVTVPASPVSRPAGLLPTRLIVAVVAVLGLGIIGSAIFTFTTFLRLQTSYLSNRGHEVAEALEGQARGPGRRNNPIFWQSLLESNYPTYSGSVEFLALVDQKGSILAYKGSTGQIPDVVPTSLPNVYIFEEPLGRPRLPHNAGSSNVAGWRIRIGLFTTETQAIQRQAVLQLAISGLAAIALVVLSVKLIRMLNRYLELKSREGAEAQLRSLGIMAASLAHEIRNPLGSMKGLTQLAQEDLPPNHTAQSKLQTVVSEAERLEKLVTDLLDFAHAKEPQISELDLVELLSGLIAMLKPRGESSGVQLEFSTNGAPILIRSDAAGLRQVLLNVLMNALDATPEKGTVNVLARYGEGRKSVMVQVDDSGQGLGPGSPEELFRPFVTTKARGTGLGLAISKQITERLGGTLTLENLPQAGARCSITLPVI
jgi:signal transduction histidine kinase